MSSYKVHGPWVAVFRLFIVLFRLMSYKGSSIDHCIVCALIILILIAVIYATLMWMSARSTLSRCAYITMMRDFNNLSY